MEIVNCYRKGGSVNGVLWQLIFQVEPCKQILISKFQLVTFNAWFFINLPNQLYLHSWQGIKSFTKGVMNSSAKATSTIDNFKQPSGHHFEKKCYMPVTLSSKLYTFHYKSIHVTINPEFGSQTFVSRASCLRILVIKFPDFW